MAKTVIPQNHITGEAPASSEVRASAEPPSRELVALRDLVLLAESTFQFLGEFGTEPATVLREALRCAKADLEVIGAALTGAPEVITDMTLYRAGLRIDLALALSEYRDTFESDNGGAES